MFTRFFVSLSHGLMVYLYIYAGSPAVDGMFIDDYWCSNLICSEHPNTAGCPCSDPVNTSL